MRNNYQQLATISISIIAATNCWYTSCFTLAVSTGTQHFRHPSLKGGGVASGTIGEQANWKRHFTTGHLFSIGLKLVDWESRPCWPSYPSIHLFKWPVGPFLCSFVHHRLSQSVHPSIHLFFSSTKIASSSSSFATLPPRNSSHPTYTGRVLCH